MGFKFSGFLDAGHVLYMAQLVGLIVSLGAIVRGTGKWLIGQFDSWVDKRADERIKHFMRIDELNEKEKE